MKQSAINTFCGFNHMHEVELEIDCHGRKLRARLIL